MKKYLILALVMVVIMVGCKVKAKFKNADVDSKVITWGLFGSEMVQTSPCEYQQFLLVNDKPIEIGFRDDGIVVWRYVNEILSSGEFIDMGWDTKVRDSDSKPTITIPSTSE